MKKGISKEAGIKGNKVRKGHAYYKKDDLFDNTLHTEKIITMLFKIHSRKEYNLIYTNPNLFDKVKECLEEKKILHSLPKGARGIYNYGIDESQLFKYLTKRLIDKIKEVDDYKKEHRKEFEKQTKGETTVENILKKALIKVRDLEIAYEGDIPDTVLENSESWYTLQNQAYLLHSFERFTKERLARIKKEKIIKKYKKKDKSVVKSNINDSDLKFAKDDIITLLKEFLVENQAKIKENKLSFNESLHIFYLGMSFFVFTSKDNFELRLGKPDAEFFKNLPNHYATSKFIFLCQAYERALIVKQKSLFLKYDNDAQIDLVADARYRAMGHFLMDNPFIEPMTEELEYEVDKTNKTIWRNKKWKTLYLVKKN